MGLFVFSLFAEFLANDKPILVKFDGGYYMPIFKLYPETAFGGEFLYGIVRVVEDEQVVARPAEQHVGPGATIEGVVAGTANERIRGFVADN